MYILRCVRPADDNALTVFWSLQITVKGEVWAGEVPTWGQNKCRVDLSVFALLFSTGNWEQLWLHYHADIKIWFCCSCKPLKIMSWNRPWMHPASLGRFLLSCFFNRSKKCSVFVRKQSPENFHKCTFLVKTYDQDETLDAFLSAALSSTQWRFKANHGTTLSLLSLVYLFIF